MGSSWLYIALTLIEMLAPELVRHHPRQSAGRVPTIARSGEFVDEL